MTEVVNVRDFPFEVPTPYLYVGGYVAGLFRGHPLANPFEPARRAKKTDRRACLDRYLDWLLSEPWHEGVLRRLAERVGRTRLPLGCWCGTSSAVWRPPLCHAVVLAEHVDLILGKQRRWTSAPKTTRPTAVAVPCGTTAGVRTDQGKDEAMSQEGIFAEVRQERAMQDALWGGPAHDDQLSQAEWVSILCRHLGLACDDGGERSERYRKQLVRVTALSVAAVEALDRKEGREHTAGSVHTGSGW